MTKIPLALTFDDVLLQPNFSSILPSEVSTQARFAKNIILKIPLISSAMDTVTESGLAIELARLGGIGVIHKNLSVEAQSAEVVKVKAAKFLVAAAVGASGDFLERAKALIAAGVDALVIDTAHGHSQRVMDAVKTIKKLNKKVAVVAGNVATKEGTLALIKAGADAVKVGIGPGSICTTRVIAGVGVPQLTAIMDAVSVAKKYKIPIIADGGIKLSGDIAKALAAGATCVMLGSLFAGTLESPGEVIEEGGKKFKQYRGMGSMGAMQLGSKDRYGQDKVESGKLVPEGIEGRVNFKGPLEQVVNQLVGGLKSGMGYLGAKNLQEFSKKAKFVQITASGLKESHPHNVQITKVAPNYHRE